MNCESVSQTVGVILLQNGCLLSLWQKGAEK